MIDIALRDYFAGQIAAGDACSGDESWSPSIDDYVIKNRAEMYYRIADAMIAASKNTKKKVSR